jgi:hypothetical protein
MVLVPECKIQVVDSKEGNLQEIFHERIATHGTD